MFSVENRVVAGIQFVARLPYLQLHNIIKMSSRRSSRLSAMSTNVQDAKPSVESTTKSVAVKGSRKRKVLKEPNTEEKSNDIFAVPSTPKRMKAAAVPPPPSTPTPAAASITAIPFSTGDKIAKHPRTSRLADPRMTNAPLLSPQTSRVVTNIPAEAVSPSKLPSAHPKITTENILEEAIAHLIKTDPRLKPVVEKHHCRIFSPEGLAEEIDPFNALASGIIGQQVSGAAAKSIKAKFIGLFNPVTSDDETPPFPTPAQVITKDIPFLRTAGLSGRKAEYIHGLADKFVSGDLSTEMLLKAEYEEVFAKLIAIRGLGAWSVQMFACFGLKRMDVFATGDLGVQRGMAALIGKDVSKLKAKGGGKFKYMSEKDMLEMSEKFAPYRSVFMWYMWRVEDVDVAVLE